MAREPAKREFPAPAQGWAKAPPFKKDEPESIHNKFNLNTATAEDLATINQMTTNRAQAIVDYRELHGPYHRMSELTKVIGISTKIQSAIKDRCYCGDPDEPSPREMYRENMEETAE